MEATMRALLLIVAAGGKDLFISRINASGSGFVFSTYLGGHQDDSCTGIALDGSSNILFTGNTIPLDVAIGNGFPITQNAVHPYMSRVTRDCVIVKLDPMSHTHAYSTFLGGTSFNSCSGIASDSNSNAYVVGETGSADFPVSGTPFGPAIPGSITVLCQLTGFVTKLNSFGSSFFYSRRMGGAKGASQLNSVTVDATRRAYVSGFTTASGYPVIASAVSTSVAGSNSKPVVSVVESDGSKLVGFTPPGPPAPLMPFSSMPTSPRSCTPPCSPAAVAATPLRFAPVPMAACTWPAAPIPATSRWPVLRSRRQNRPATPCSPGASTIPPPPANAPTVTSVVNGASFANAAVAAGSVITLMGTNLGTAGTTVVNGHTIPLFYTRPTQTNGSFPSKLASARLSSPSAPTVSPALRFHSRSSPPAPGAGDYSVVITVSGVPSDAPIMSIH
jgi:hypothetical protein